MKLTHLAAAALVGLTASAQALTIDFNEYANDTAYQFVNPVVTNGYVFSNSNGGSDALGVWGRGSTYQADPGNAAIFVNHGGTTTTMAAVSGAAFDFYSIDLADVYNIGASVTVGFTFNYFGGGSNTASVTLDNLVGLQTFVFNEKALRSVSWATTAGANGWNQFDNVNTTPVPEPETYALMLAGLAALGWKARRRSA